MEKLLPKWLSKIRRGCTAKDQEIPQRIEASTDIEMPIQASQKVYATTTIRARQYRRVRSVAAVFPPVPEEQEPLAPNGIHEYSTRDKSPFTAVNTSRASQLRCKPVNKECNVDTVYEYSKASPASQIRQNWKSSETGLLPGTSCSSLNLAELETSETFKIRNSKWLAIV